MAAAAASGGGASKSKPMWMEYVDLGARIAIPLAVVGATVWFNAAAESRRLKQAETQTEIQAKQTCLDNQFKLTSAVCQNAECSMTEARAKQVVGLSAMTGDLCERAGIEISKEAAAAVSASVAATNLGEGGAVATNLGLVPETQEAKPVSRPEVALRPSVGPDPRIYIHFADETQRASVNQLIERLAGARLAGRPIVFPPIDLVPATARQTQIRCMTRADCEQVRELAGILSAAMEQPVAPADFSARYEQTNKARPLHYELWIARGAVGAPPATGP